MDLVRLVYFSENRLDPINGPVLGALQDILRISKYNNERRGLTGALAFDDLWFFQVLEGRREAVWSTFRTIIGDHRHGDVMLVESVPVTERLFGKWSMRLNKRGASFDRFVRANIVRPELMSGADIVAAIDALAGRKTSCPETFALAS